MNTIETATNDILTHHLTAFGCNDLDEIMLDYIEQSIILSDKGAIKGLDKIRQFFETMFGLIPTGSHFEMKQLTVSENAAHIIWASKSATADLPFGTDTFIVEKEKIMVHTVAAFSRNQNQLIGGSDQEYLHDSIVR
jgi:ketosteroid isomerase-like protein